jgi:hypothetical protein
MRLAFLPATVSIEDLALHFDPVGSWWGVAAVAAVLGAVLFFVGPDRTRVSSARLAVLVALRLGAFLALVGCMLRPTFVSTKKARQPATLVVLADASESMSVADGPDGRTRWDEMVEALAAARPAAQALVGEGTVSIARWRFDRDCRPVAAGDPDPLALGPRGEEPSGEETAIGAALDDAVRAAAGRNIAGIVVLSDGAQHAYPPRDVPPQTVARKLGEAGVPLWSVTFGQQRGAGQARDAALVNLAVGETVYVKNSLEVSARVRLEGLGDREAVVKLLTEDDKGGMEEAARTTVRGGPQSAEVPVRLEWTPKSLGEKKLSVVVEPQEGEVVTTNNELSTFVDVIDGGLRVLYLEGALRVEQRFLRRVLAASPDMQVDFQWIDAAKRANWPVDISRALAADHNVILIGDLDSSALRPADLAALAGRVRAGAGLGMLGGFHAFEAGGWATSPLGPALPFQSDRLARQPFGEPVRESLHLRGPLQMMPDQRFGGVSILRLGATDQDSRTAWQALPPLDGANDLGRLDPTAKPLAVTPDGRPLLVAREFGAGRVLAFAADSTWRWVMQGAGEQHRRFWRQMVLWLAKQDGAEKDALWVRPAQRRLSPGGTLQFDVGLTQPDGAAVADASFQAAVVAPSGGTRPVRVARRGETSAGSIGEFTEAGDWKLVVKAVKPGVEQPFERTTRFTVYRQDLELANPRANPLLMRQLAEATPGGVRSPEEIAGILDEIRTRPAAYETLEQWSYAPWDKWPMFLLMAGFLCGEWFARKRFGLV